MPTWGIGSIAIGASGHRAETPRRGLGGEILPADLAGGRLGKLRLADDHALDALVGREGVPARLDLAAQRLEHERVVARASGLGGERFERRAVGDDVRVNLSALAAR